MRFIQISEINPVGEILKASIDFKSSLETVFEKMIKKRSQGRGFLFAKLKTIASFSILFGVVLLLAKVDEIFKLYNIPYILIIFGFMSLIISLLATNKEKSFLCRIGLHRYERIGRDCEVQAMFIYKCKRCGKQKKAATLI